MMRHPLWHGLSCIVALVMLLVSLPSSTAALEAARNPPQRSNRIHWLGGDYFLSGINYPFARAYGADIATFDPPSSGQPGESYFDLATLERDFAIMEAGGVHVLRWFLFGDGRAAPEFDAAGRVTGLDVTFFAHMDEALAIARRHNIYIIWSLFDFLAFKPANWLCPPNGERILDESTAIPPELREQYERHLRLAAHKEAYERDGKLKRLDSPAAVQFCPPSAGGHRNIVTDSAPGGVQESFFRNALEPLLRQYAADPNIIGWEIINEPEWAVFDRDHAMWENRSLQQVTLAQMQSFFQRFTATMHAQAPEQLATVGATSLRYMGSSPYVPGDAWQGLGFDYYGAHYYGWMDDVNASPTKLDYNTEPTLQHLDAPVVIGEFPADGGTPPVYLPYVRRQDAESSELTLRYICKSFSGTGAPDCSRDYEVVIKYYSPSGELALAQTVTLAPNSSWQGGIPGSLGDWTGAAHVVSNGPVAAQVSQHGIAAAAESVTYMGQDRGATALYLPSVLNLDNNHRTRIALQNSSVSTATVAVKFYERSGTLVLTDTLTLGPRGMALIDPDIAPGAGAAGAGTQAPTAELPLDFVGAAGITSSEPLVVVVYELDPVGGSAAYNAVPEGYGRAVNLPSLRNAGADSRPSLVLQNAWNTPIIATLRYYNQNGTPLAVQHDDVVILTGYSSVELDLAARLPLGFDGSAQIDSAPFLAALVRSRSTELGSGAQRLLYSSSVQADQLFHFPRVSSSMAKDGPSTVLIAQNVHPTTTITIATTFLSSSGAATVYSTTIPPDGSLLIEPAQYLGSDFSGSVDIRWPWVKDWPFGYFPLVAAGRSFDALQSRGGAYMGMVSHADVAYVTPHTPDQLLSLTLANNWAGALAWSFQDGAAGRWDDYVDASKEFDRRYSHLTAIGPTPPCPFNFSDVTPQAFYYEALRDLFCSGVISGYGDGTFRAYNNATRGQLAKIITLSEGWELDSSGAQQFSDVTPANPFFAYIETARSKGVLSGYSDGTFRPANNVTRGQIAKIIVLARGWPIEKTGAPHFTDVSRSNTFYDAIETAYNRGIISGYTLSGGGLEFRWGADATRGQITKIVSLARNSE